MSAASDYLESQVGNHLLRTASWTKPAAIYIALFTVMPVDAGTGGTEVSGGAYARVLHGPSDATWAITDGVCSNLGAVQFPSPSGANWGTIVGFGLYDASTVGNLLVYGTLDASVIVNDGDPAPAFAEGALTVTIA